MHRHHLCLLVSRNPFTIAEGVAGSQRTSQRSELSIPNHLHCLPLFLPLFSTLFSSLTSAPYSPCPLSSYLFVKNLKSTICSKKSSSLVFSSFNECLFGPYDAYCNFFLQAVPPKCRVKKCKASFSSELNFSPSHQRI